MNRPQNPQSIPSQQLSLFGEQPHPVIRKIKTLDINKLTPIDALNLLHKLQEEC